MPVPNFTAADYLAALQALFPRGRAWPREPEAVQTQVLAGLAQIFAAIGSNAAQLLVDAFPSSTNQLLEEWESSVGLPDDCIGLLPTIQQRRNLVVSRLAVGGGQSVAYLVEYAASLGFAITITEFAPARVGLSRVGKPLRGTTWAHAWQVNTSSITEIFSRCDTSVAGDPLTVWGNTQLFCELNRISPAHTEIIFNLS